MLLPRSWLRTKLDVEMSSSPDTRYLLLAGFASMSWSVVLESTVLDLLNLTLKPVQNFLNHLVTVLWSTPTSPFAQRMFLVASAELWFISAFFESHTKWSNAQCISAPTSTILTTIVGTYNGLNCFGHLTYALQSSTYQNRAKLFFHLIISGVVEWAFIWSFENFSAFVKECICFISLVYVEQTWSYACFFILEHLTRKGILIP